MQMKSHKKKMVAPIVVSVIIILYYIVLFAFLWSALEGVWKYVFSVVPIGISGVMIKVCIERINEIKKGEEDDLSKY